METFYHILFTLSILLNILLLFGVRNLLKQTEAYEAKILEERADVKLIANHALDAMNDADIRGSFKSDDEVGAAFDDIKSIVDGLHTQL